MADIKYTVTIDAATGVAEIKKLEGEINKLAETTKTGGNQATDASSKFGEYMKGIVAGYLSFQAINKVGTAFVGFMRDSISAAAESEVVNTRLNMALLSTGREVNVLSEHYNRQSQILMKLTRYDDEAIKSTQALLIQTTALTSQGIDKATRAAIGLATVFGIDLASASELVSRWMQGNTDRLVRYGIHVTDTMTTEQKRNEILRQLTVYYQQAEAATGTFSGKTDNLKKAINEFKEAVGSSIIENNTFTGSMDSLKKTFENLERIVKAIPDWFEQVVKKSTSFMAVAMWIKIVEKATREAADAAEKANKHYTNWVLDAIEASKKYNEHPIKMPPTPEELAAAKKRLDEVKKIHQEARETLMKGERDWIEKQKKNAEEVKEIHQKAREALMKGERDWIEKQKKNQEDVKKIHADARQWLMDNQKKYFENLKEEAEKAKEKMISLIGDIQSAFSNLFGAISDLSRATGDRQLDDLDRVYEAQKKQVIDSLMTEQQKADQLKILDEKQEIARKQLQRQLAKDQKAVAVFQAIINTAVAIVKALSSAAPPWNFILAAMSAAAGAIQIAAIKAQPIPLAQGGIFTRPTHIMAEAGAEAVIPLDRIQEVAGRMGGGGNRIIHFHNHIYLGGQKIKEQIVELIERASREGTLKLAAKAIQ